MIKALASARESSGQAHDGEARLLAELLRTSRLTLLYGEAGVDKTAFLHSALTPLLRRRAGDRNAAAAARDTGGVVPFADRRRRPAGSTSKHKREFVVHFDDWSGPPLAALLACIHQTANTSAAERAAPWQRLGDTLESLCSRLDANFIILLDRFEEFLMAPNDREGHAEFIGEWIEALQRAPLSANFLISVNDDARPRLASLRSRIPGFDDLSLKLMRPPGTKAAAACASSPPAEPAFAPIVIEPPLLTDSVAVPDRVSATRSGRSAAAAAPGRTAHPPKVKRPAPPAVKTEDVYALIEATLARTVTEVASDPFPDSPEPAAVLIDAVADPAPPTVRADASARIQPGRWRVVVKQIGRLLHLNVKSR